VFYNNLSGHLKRVFGERVHKISVMTGLSCPNRNGTLSAEGCIFCDPYGSGAILDDPSNPPPIEDQIKINIGRIKKRFACNKFIAYFQAFSNTNTSPKNLKELVERALSFQEIVGISISTRPDLLEDGIMEVLKETSSKTYLWVEIGIQTANDETLKRINRNHTFRDVASAVTRLHGQGIKVCGHVILGLPGEERKDVLFTAQVLSELKVDGIKIHPLFVAKESPLETGWRQGEVDLLDEETYVKWVVDFLEYIPPETVIHRLVGAGRRGIHLAPDWPLQKQKIINRINEEFKSRGTRQGERMQDYEA